MGDNAHRADLLSGLAHSTRTGLDHQTQREGIERPGGSAAAPGELMRLFVAIAPPPAVLDELDALVEPLRARRLDLRWTNREAWHVTLARCRMPADVTELVAALDGYQGQPWTADRVHLVRSRLGATEHPRYTSLANWPLRTPPVTTTG